MLPNQARSPFAWISGESIALIATLLALLLEEFYGHAQMFAAPGAELFSASSTNARLTQAINLIR
jgi:hypothetical protein